MDEIEKALKAFLEQKGNVAKEPIEALLLVNSELEQRGNSFSNQEYSVRISLVNDNLNLMQLHTYLDDLREYNEKIAIPLWKKLLDNFPLSVSMKERLPILETIQAASTALGEWKHPEREPSDPKMETYFQCVFFSPIWLEQYYKHIKKLVGAWQQRHKDLQSFENILNIGCGFGHPLLYLKEELLDNAKNVVAIDISQKLINLAKKCIVAPSSVAKQMGGVPHRLLVKAAETMDSNKIEFRKEDE